MPQAVEVKGQAQQQRLADLQRQAAARCFGREFTFDHREDRFYLRARPVAVVRPIAEPSLRLLSESLRFAREHASSATLDGEFARDLEEVINSHPELLNPPPHMGLILDASVVIAAERSGETVERLVERVLTVAGDQEAALAAVGLTELIHGIYRARTPQVRLRREVFFDELLVDFTVYP